MDASDLDTLRIVLDPAVQTMVACSLVLMMFAVSLGLKPEHFAFFKSSPRIFLGGLAAQIIGLPLLTFGLILILNPPASIALGMIVVAACPGGNVSNLMVHFSRGATALSVSMTAASSMIAAVMTPTAILFWARMHGPTSQLLDSIEFDAISFLLQTTALLALPLVAGMAISHKAPLFAAAAQRILAPASGLLLVTIIILGTIQLFPVLWPFADLILPPAIIHNAAAFSLGWVVARALRAPDAARRAITFEVGIQNSGVALVILLSQLQGLGGAAAIAAVWGVWHFFTGGAILSLYRLIDARKGVRPNEF